MHILILGSGGREHALAWAIRQNPKCDQLSVAPGNAGIAALATCVDIDIFSGQAVADWASAHKIDLVIIGPEGPLAAGVADVLRARQIPVFGPSKAAARLESSKAFTKEICSAAGAPTAASAHFKDLAAARAYVKAQGAPIVIKADGLAAGKGVVVAMTLAEALDSLEDMFGGALGAAGAEVVIEEFMDGEEASFFFICDGEIAVPVGTAQDHKRAFDGDQGPNTGGMGAYSPAPVLTEEIQEQVTREIVKPTLAEMVKRGTPFQGVLYVGLMIKDGRARLVEYNVRFGDPECQVLMMRMGAQVLDIIEAAVQGRLDGMQVHWANDHALTVVMAANGYPGDYAKGSVINGLDAIRPGANQMVFHAGTKAVQGHVTAHGGRVLNVTARGDTLAEARDKAYELVAQIDWPEGFCRTDIGWRALSPES
jgi:phosphoribosylamine---glycine ligase